MNKEALAQQIKDMETKLAEMKAELEKPEPVINYWQPKPGQNHWYVNVYGNVQRNYTVDQGLLKKDIIEFSKLKKKLTNTQTT